MVDGILSRQQEKDLPVGEAWDHYFPYLLRNLRIAEKEDNPFIGFLRYSFYRPRDIICYLKIMQEDVKLHESEERVFSYQSYKRCQTKYSDYLLGEVKDYLRFYFSNVDFNAISGFFRFFGGRSRFTWEEFRAVFQKNQESLKGLTVTVPELKQGPEEFLQFLYSLNIIGYIEKTDSGAFVHWCFRDRTPVTLKPKVMLGREYTVHPGLARALNVGGGVGER